MQVRAFGRSLSDFEPLLPLEQELLKACSKGDIAQGQAECPEEATSDNKVRAEFIRFLLLGGDDRVAIHERGVQLSKAFVLGALDLRSTVVDTIFTLQHCTLNRVAFFSGATFNRSIDMEGSRIKGIWGRGMSVAGDFHAKKIVAQYSIGLDNSFVGGALSFSGAVLNGSSGLSISAIDSRIQGGVYLTDGFRADGLVKFLGAEVGGQFNCRAGHFLKEGESLMASNIKVGGGVFLIHGFKSRGKISFIAAAVKVQFSLHGASLACKDGLALIADRMSLNGTFYMGEGFKSEGGISLNGGDIQGQINGSGAVLSGEQKTSFFANNLHVTGTVFLDRGFSSKGRLSFASAKIDGDLSFRDAEFIGSLYASKLQVLGALIIFDIKKPMSKVSLASARVTALNDNAQSWGQHLILNGFVYEFLDVHNTMTVADRVKWLEKQCSRFPGDEATPLPKPNVFVPQPWQQLKTVLENMGRVEESREIGIEYERHRAKCGQIGLTPAAWNPVRRGLNWGFANALHFSYGKLIGYGYRPMQLVPWFMGVWLLTTALYWYAANQEAVFAPTDPLIFQNTAYMTCQPSSDKTFEPAPGTGNWYLCNALAQEYTGFSPIAFSLDLLLPLVDLHQEKDWAPLIETPKANVVDELRGFFTLKRFVRFVMWVEILAGWVFSLLFVVIVSGLARRKEQ